MSAGLISTPNINTFKKKYDFTIHSAMKLNTTKSLGATHAQEKEK